MAYVLITGIDHENERMEILYKNGTTKICDSYDSRYPMNVRTATGGLLDNKLIVCGGDYPVNSACFSLGRDFKWTLLTYMATPRFV